MDRIDEIVFDMSASIATREQALAFVMDHTEGFDELEGGVQLNFAVCVLSCYFLNVVV